MRFLALLSCILLAYCLPAVAMAQDAAPPEAVITVSWWAPVVLAVVLNAITSVLVFWFREANRRNEEAILARIMALEEDSRSISLLLAQTRETYATKVEMERLVSRMDGIEQRLGDRLGKLEVGIGGIERGMTTLLDTFTAASRTR